MKTRILALTGALVLIAAFPAVAGTNKFSKSLKGGGTVSFKVKTNKKGTATKLTSINVNSLPAKCTTVDTVTDQVVSASLGKVKVTKQSLGGSTTYQFNLQKTVAGRRWQFRGAFSSRKGRKVSEGFVGVGYLDGALDCSGGTTFKAKRK